MALTPVILNPGAGGSQIQTDNIGGNSYEVVKVAFGAEGTATMVDGSNPLPVTVGLTDAQLRASAVPTIEAAPTTILNGQTTVTTAGSRVVLSASAACKSVTVKAFITNTGIIYVGNSSVSSSNGFRLSAGDTVSMDISNLNTVNIDSSVNGESVSYLGVN